MYFRPNEINSNKIHDKFDGFYNVTNVIKIKIINEMNPFQLMLCLDSFFFL